MSTHQPAGPKADLEPAIRRMIAARPKWFNSTVYVAAHLSRLNQWVLNVYQPTSHYKPDEQYEQHTTPPRYWWWMVKLNSDGSHDILLLLEDVIINPIYVAVDHIGDAVLEIDPYHLALFDKEEQ